MSCILASPTSFILDSSGSCFSGGSGKESHGSASPDSTLSAKSLKSSECPVKRLLTVSLDAEKKLTMVDSDSSIESSHGERFSPGNVSQVSFLLSELAVSFGKVSGTGSVSF
ncbi:uncharacterized protein LOC113468256 [Diaphorina citri]|uniref:Uncharacterized protein LOC113468256 n=1 Tax=Diaphorina citri TaxID=121845 RepID=A0A3Q0IX68_DIACI|nr:uncharacterized protein LOC113468256 [Diaphorina citri]